MIWNSKAIDYNVGMNIIDCKTNKIYTEEEAFRLKNENNKIVKSLILQPKKIGTWVLTIEECKKIMKEKENGQRNN